MDKRVYKHLWYKYGIDLQEYQIPFVPKIDVESSLAVPALFS
jgi:hypothetical protein